MAARHNNGGFLGTGWAFPPQFSHAGTGMVSDERDIHQSLQILLSTRPGERVMNPLYGCGIQSIAFENISESTNTEIQVMVADAIHRCEPRVSVELVAVYPDQGDAARLNIEVIYLVSATNSAHNLVFPFYIADGIAALSQPE